MARRRIPTPPPRPGRNPNLTQGPYDPSFEVGRRSKRPALTRPGRCGPHRAQTLWRHSGTLAQPSRECLLIRKSSASGTRGAVEFAVSTGRHSRSGPRPSERAADGPIAEILVDPEHRSVRLVVLCGDEFDATFGCVH